MMLRPRSIALVLLPLIAGGAAACDNTDVPNSGQAEPAAESQSTGATVEVDPVDLQAQTWFQESGTVDFAGRTWILSGEPIYDPAVERVGEYQGTPLYAEMNTAQPYSELFIPLENDLWQMLVPGDTAGVDATTGTSRGAPGVDPVGNPTGGAGQ